MLGDSATSGNYSKMVVFDIDETVLSNLEEIYDAGLGKMSTLHQDLHSDAHGGPTVLKPSTHL